MLRTFEFLFALTLQIIFVRSYIAENGLWTGKDFTQGYIKILNGIATSTNADIQRSITSAQSIPYNSATYL